MAIQTFSKEYYQLVTCGEEEVVTNNIKITVTANRALEPAFCPTGNLSGVHPV